MARIRLSQRQGDFSIAAAQLELVSTRKAINDLQDTAGTDLAQAVIDLREAQEQFEKADNYLTYLRNSQKVPQTETRSFLIQTWKGYEYQYATIASALPARRASRLTVRDTLANE